MMNVGVNQVTAVLTLPYGAIQSNGRSCEIPEARRLAENAMREVIAVANAEGIDLNESDIVNSFNTTDLLNPESFTSMCQDVLAKRKTELEMFSPVIMELAQKHGLSVPVNETLYLQLRIIEKRQSL
jgi:2-dehydropantoate 2-reductase